MPAAELLRPPIGESQDWRLQGSQSCFRVRAVIGTVAGDTLALGPERNDLICNDGFRYLSPTTRAQALVVVAGQNSQAFSAPAGSVIARGQLVKRSNRTDPGVWVGGLPPTPPTARHWVAVGQAIP